MHPIPVFHFKPILALVKEEQVENPAKTYGHLGRVCLWLESLKDDCNCTPNPEDPKTIEDLEKWMVEFESKPLTFGATAAIPPILIPVVTELVKKGFEQILKWLNR
jgi:hypothetical protein